MQCPVCRWDNSGEAVFCEKCGARIARKPPPVEAEIADEAEVRVRRRPADSGELATRPKRRRIVTEEDERPSGGAIVPYRNPLALFAYYCVFLGFIIGIGATTAVVIFASGATLSEDHIRLGKIVIYIGFIVGMIVELAAFLLGIFGLLCVRNHPTARGTGHAIMGVVLGPIFIIAQLAALIFMISWINSQIHT
jgi:hypothetical protein